MHDHDHEHDHMHDHDHEHEHEHEHHHDHEHEEGCCGGHDHDHEHEHEHHHDHDHEHHHDHDHEGGCCGGHDHEHHHEEHDETPFNEDNENRVYILEGLDCPNCAAKVEAKIAAMPEVEAASVSYPTKQLRVTAKNQDALLPKLQATIDAIEDGITVVPKKKKSFLKQAIEKAQEKAGAKPL